MKKLEYLELCDVCDTLLSREGVGVERIANSSLHILNEHPTNLDKYERFYSEHHNTFFFRFKNLLKHFCKILFTTTSYSGYSCSKKIEDHVDLIFVSHLLTDSHLGCDNDFYFGSIHEEQSSKNLTSLVVLHDHRKKSSKLRFGDWRENVPARLLFDKRLNFLEEIRLWFNQKKDSDTLLTIAEKSPSGPIRNIIRNAASEGLSGTSINNVRFYYQLKKLINEMRPKAIIVTYEGHAWERLAFAAARSVDTKIKCIGYHHTILYPMQHAIKRALGGAFDPDEICTAGYVTKQKLLENLNECSINLSVIGSHRRSLNSVSVDSVVSKYYLTKCLVIPDGTLSECILIFNFVYELAKTVKNVEFIIRMHPIISFSDLGHQDKKFITPPLNIIFSNFELEEDFKRCRWVLYRGTSAVIHAVRMGLQPFYIKHPEELTLNPLLEMKFWVRDILNSNEFISYLSIDFNEHKKFVKSEWLHAKKYCEDYFSMFNMKSLLNRIGND